MPCRWVYVLPSATDLTFVPTISFRILSLSGLYIILVSRSLFLCEVALLYSLVFFGGLGHLISSRRKSGFSGAGGFCFGVFIAYTCVSYYPFPSPRIRGIIIYLGGVHVPRNLRLSVVIGAGGPRVELNPGVSSFESSL